MALGTSVRTGARCPESGQWCVRDLAGDRSSYRRFRKGDVMPTYSLYQPRRFEILDDIFGMRYADTPVEWVLVRYPNATS
jgi:hypothetical protein